LGNPGFGCNWRHSLLSFILTLGTLDVLLLLIFLNLKLSTLAKLRSSSSLLAYTLVLSACAAAVKVPVEERTVLTVRQQSEMIGGQVIRIVQSGDTLYGIAFESDLDVNRLAAWNGISDTSQLPVGQRVRLTKPTGFVYKPRRKVALNGGHNNQPQVAKRADTIETIAAKGIASKSVAVKNKAPVRQTSYDASSNTVSALSIKKSSQIASRDVAGVNWSWPFEGKVIRRFSLSSTQQGIDILGKGGQPVMASAAGEVVYVGNSLKGYGNLVIIKHNDNFLSAYAHNQRILVAEGQKITESHIIGFVGVNNRRESALHFQIRRKGKPVNPLSYLSVRSS
jgi:lipoprotein NlpD